MKLKVEIIKEDVFILLEDVEIKALGYTIRVKKGFDFGFLFTFANSCISFANIISTLSDKKGSICEYSYHSQSSLYDILFSSSDTVQPRFNARRNKNRLSSTFLLYLPLKSFHLHYL